MKEEIGIAFPDQTQHWQEIKNLQKLRNVIAHRGGVLSESRATGHLGNYIRNHNHLRLDSRFQGQPGPADIVVESGFFNEMGCAIKGFSRDLRSELPRFEPDD